jgi:hypothetical protein
MPTYPGSRPAFADRETYGEAIDSAILTRRLMDWQSWTWACDLTRTPGDWRQMDSHQDFPLAGENGAYRNPDVSLTQFYVPPSRNGSRTLRVWLWITTANWTLKITNTTTGEATQVTGVGGWSSVDIACEGPATFRVDWMTNDALYPALHSLSAFWVAPAVAGSWQPIKQDYVAAGISDSAYLMRWLARTSNQFAAWKSQNVVQTSFMAWQRGNVAADTYWHRYKVVVSPKATKLNVFVNAQRTAGYAGFLRIYINGTQVGAFQPNAGAWAWNSAGCNINGGSGYSVPTEIEVSIGHDAIGATDLVGVAGVNAYEGGGDANGLSATDLGLPGGDSVPSGFAQLYRELIAGHEPIRADKDHLARTVGRAALVKNMVWLWSRRLPGCVINQSLYMGKSVCATNFVWPMNDATGTGGNLVLGHYYLHPTFPVAEVTNRLWRVRMWNLWTRPVLLGRPFEDDVGVHRPPALQRRRNGARTSRAVLRLGEAARPLRVLDETWATGLRRICRPSRAAPTQFWLGTRARRHLPRQRGDERCMFEERPLTDVSVDTW